jgi:hypothetical protein
MQFWSHRRSTSPQVDRKPQRNGSDVRSHTARRETRTLNQLLAIFLKEVGQFTVIQTRLRPISFMILGSPPR